MKFRWGYVIAGLSALVLVVILTYFYLHSKNIDFPLKKFLIYVGVIFGVMMLIGGGIWFYFVY